MAFLSLFRVFLRFLLRGRNAGENQEKDCEHSFSILSTSPLYSYPDLPLPAIGRGLRPEERPPSPCPLPRWERVAEGRACHGAALASRVRGMPLAPCLSSTLKS